MKTNLLSPLKNLVIPLLAVTVAAGFVAGCTTPQKKETKAKFSFYPAPPDDPHVQFLTSFQSSKDFANSGESKFKTFLTGRTEGTMTIAKPYGGVAGKGLFYVCDTAQGAVLRLNLKEQKMDAIVGAGSVTFMTPVNMAMDDDGSMYIVDMSLNEMFIVDKDQHLAGRIGGKNEMKPMDVAVTKERIYLSDLSTHNIHVYEKASQKLLFDIPRGEDATNPLHKLYQPINIAVDSKGNVYASDLGADEVRVFTSEGKYLRTVGERGDNFGEFSRNKGIALDREDRLYAVEAAGQFVQMFDPTGHLLMWFGEPSRDRVSLMLPAKVLVDYDDVPLFQKYAAPNFEIEHLLVVMNQYGPMKVAVFGFGHKK